MAPDQFTKQDPTTQYPQPEQPSQQLDHPGLESEMELRPDYGAQSYRGSDRLVGRRAVITGGDWVSAVRSPSRSRAKGRTS